MSVDTRRTAVSAAREGQRSTEGTTPRNLDRPAVNARHDAQAEVCVHEGLSGMVIWVMVRWSPSRFQRNKHLDCRLGVQSGGTGPVGGGPFGCCC